MRRQLALGSHALDCECPQCEVGVRENMTARPREFLVKHKSAIIGKWTERQVHKATCSCSRCMPWPKDAKRPELPKETRAEKKARLEARRISARGIPRATSARILRWLRRRPASASSPRPPAPSPRRICGWSRINDRHHAAVHARRRSSQPDILQMMQCAGRAIPHTD